MSRNSTSREEAILVCSNRTRRISSPPMHASHLVSVMQVTRDRPTRLSAEETVPMQRQIFLEMPRFTKEADECENDFERWLYLIKNMHMLKRMPFNAQRAVWDKLLDIADTSALNAEELKVYEEELKIYRDYHNTMNTARKEGLREGLKEGLKKGMEKGKEAGMKAERIEIAKNLKALGECKLNCVSKE